MDHLDRFDQKGVFPLLAALADDDAQVADASAEILGNIYDLRSVPVLMEQLKFKADRGDELYNSPFYTALQKLGCTDTGGVMKKAPNAAEEALLGAFRWNRFEN